MFNKVILIGNLGHSPDIHNFQSGDKVAKLSVATSESYKDKNGEKKTITEWHNCVVFGKGAEIAEMYLNKGSKILFEGKLKTRTYEGRDGVTKYITEIVGNFKMMGNKETENTKTEPTKSSVESKPENTGEIKRNDIGMPEDKSTNENNVEVIDDESDDLPF